MNVSVGILQKAWCSLYVGRGRRMALIFFKTNESICLLTSVVLSSLLIWLDNTHFPFDYNGKRKGRSWPKLCGPMLKLEQPKFLVLSLLHSLWHSQPVVNFKFEKCHCHGYLHKSLLPQIFSASSLMNLGVMLSVKRWRRCCMWLMGKSQSHSRNASLRYFMQLFSCCIYKKVKITLSSFFFILMHVWEQIDLI